MTGKKVKYSAPRKPSIEEISYDDWKPREWRLVAVRKCRVQSMRLETPEAAWKFWRSEIPKSSWFDETKESMVVLLINSDLCLFGFSLIAVGSMDAIPIRPCQVFRPAVVAASRAIVVVHNHPSGDLTPSQEDIDLTRALKAAGEILKIDLFDHLIMGDQDYLSMRGEGYFEPKATAPDTRLKQFNAQLRKMRKGAA
jgi:DNA repair protein RadC